MMPKSSRGWAVITLDSSYLLGNAFALAFSIFVESFYDIIPENLRIIEISLSLLTFYPIY